MPRAIADASTLIHLASIGRFDLLETFHGHVIVPTAVWDEVVRQGEDRPGASELRSARKEGWVDVEEPGRADLVKLLRRDLGPGEAEAIALAAEHPDRILLVDESAARETAAVYEIVKTGVVGILLRAKKEGEIASLARALSTLRQEAGFWIDDALVEQVLAEAGEEDSWASGAED